MEAILNVTNLKKGYMHSTGWVEALNDISFSIIQPNIIAIIGPSGCGKSTLLKILCGLEKPTSGNIECRMPNPKIIMVWQDHRLFPWRTVWSNIAFGLEIQKYDKATIKNKVNYYMQLTKLAGFEKFYPHEISLGMQQRTSIARSLAVKPDILLLDEPFSSLDFQTKRIFLKELKFLQRELHIPMIYVTHDTREAVKFADEVIVLSRRPAKLLEKIVKKPEDDLYRLEKNIQRIITKQVEESI